eukprot:scaffold21634_cov50-Attheya_sp.AAC.2
MDPLPPNDPNPNSNGSEIRAKDDPHDGESQRRRRRSGDVNEDGEVEVFGDLRDQGFVVVMFMMGLASWLLRERCTC